jgi:hypothetical protein
MSLTLMQVPSSRQDFQCVRWSGDFKRRRFTSRTRVNGTFRCLHHHKWHRNYPATTAITCKFATTYQCSHYVGSSTAERWLWIVANRPEVAAAAYQGVTHSSGPMQAGGVNSISQLDQSPVFGSAEHSRDSASTGLQQALLSTSQSEVSSMLNSQRSSASVGDALTPKTEPSKPVFVKDAMPSTLGLPSPKCISQQYTAFTSPLTGGNAGASAAVSQSGARDKKGPAMTITGIQKTTLEHLQRLQGSSSRILIVQPCATGKSR